MEIGTRRLAAIAVADVVGFSRMMAADEDGTLSALHAHRAAIDPLVLNHGGRIVKSTGDGVLVEFPSATAALRAALEIQDIMGGRNDALPESRRMQFRVGINVSEVVADDSGDVYGDGVNIAARIEALADPGGISITNAVYEAVRDKIHVAFHDDGEHALKNIPRPVRVWKVAGGPHHHTPTPRVTTARTLATVAVLPFDNMSDDPDQEYFADGITEDLLTALSYDRDLAVVARNSTFAYRGTPTDVRTVARELDATHVVEGSVRKGGDRVRVTAQLIDAETGHHLWADRYDGKLDDIFALQDEMVAAIASKLRPFLRETAGKRHTAAGIASFDAWDLTIRGRYHLNTNSIDGAHQAIELFDQARRLEPQFAPPVASSAIAWMILAALGWRREGVNAWERGYADAEAAYVLDGDDHMVLTAISMARSQTGRPEDGIAFARRMIELNPLAAMGYHLLGHSLDVSGKPHDAVGEFTKAWQLGSHEPIRFDIANDLGHAHYMTDNYEAARTWGEQSLRLLPNYLIAHILLAATHGQLGESAERRQHVEAVLAARPEFSCARFRTRLGYIHDRDRDHFIDGLRKAGLPE